MWQKGGFENIQNITIGNFLVVHSNAQLNPSRSFQARVGASSRIYVLSRLVAAAGVRLPLLHDHGLQVLTLVHLHLNLLDDVAQVGSVLLESARLRVLGVVCLTSSGLVHSVLGRS